MQQHPLSNQVGNTPPLKQSCVNLRMRAWYWQHKKISHFPPAVQTLPIYLQVNKLSPTPPAPLPRKRADPEHLTATTHQRQSGGGGQSWGGTPPGFHRFHHPQMTMLCSHAMLLLKATRHTYEVPLAPPRSGGLALQTCHAGSLSE